VTALKNSIQGNYEPIKYTDLPAPSQAANNAEQKTVIEIKDLHPFKFKKHQFLVTVVIKKVNVDSSWWYTACDTCNKTAKRFGNGYRCADPTCPPVVLASPRFKLNVIAGDDTADSSFIIFGRLAQRLIGRSVETLLQQNPSNTGCIPKEITDLLEKEFT
jgi:hypothetical protein